MRRLILLSVLLAVVAGCGGGGSLAAPSGAVMTLTPTSKDAPIEITSTSALQKSTVQLYQLSVKDSSLAGAKGVRDTIFNVTFELTNVPGTATADLTSLVTLCDGSAIINTTAEKQTDNQGNYNLCVVFKVGGGLNYTGNLRVLSGSSNASTALKVTSTLPALAISPTTLTIPAGSRGQFTITGGSPEYTVTSSDPSVPAVPLVVAASGGTFLVTIPAGTPKGTTLSYTVRDSAGVPVAATVTVGDPPPPTVLPSAATVIAGGTVKFTIIGGVPNYTVFADNASITFDHNTVTASGGTFRATVAANALDKQITLTVRDSIGGSVDVKITVQAPPALKIVPDKMTIVAGFTGTFAITGGVPGYTVVSDNSFVSLSPSHVADSGDTFRVVTSSDLKTGFTVTAIDSIGQPISAIVTVTPVKSSQTIIPGTAPTVIVGGTGTVSAAATSGLPVTFTSLTTSVCTVSGVTVTGVSAGTCTIAADQAGSTDYYPAQQTILTINVGKGSQTITLGTLPSVIVGGTGTISATGGASGLPVTFISNTPSVCTVIGATVKGVSAGTCSIAADQAGNANYNAAPTLNFNLTINP